MVAVSDGPPSPKIKVEPAEQLAGWVALGELAVEIDGVQVPLPDGTPVVVDITGDDGDGAGAATAGGGSSGRGGRGVPKRCSVCRQPKKGGCACVKTKAEPRARL